MVTLAFTNGRPKGQLNLLQLGGEGSNDVTISMNPVIGLDLGIQIWHSTAAESAC